MKSSIHKIITILVSTGVMCDVLEHNGKIQTSGTYFFKETLRSAKIYSVASTDQSSWLQIQISRDRFPALPDFLRSIGSETGSTQHREYN
jgi:hypothetical protein